MSNEKQTFTRTDSDHLRDLRITSSNHTPSWRTGPSSGYAEFRAYSHREAGWTQLSVEEGYNDNGRWTSRKTFLCLDKEAAIALRDLLVEQYPINRMQTLGEMEAADPMVFSNERTR